MLICLPLSQIVRLCLSDVLHTVAMFLQVHPIQYYMYQKSGKMQAENNVPLAKFPDRGLGWLRAN